MAKKFFYVCAGLFLLAGAYVMGARKAEANFGEVYIGGLPVDASGWAYVMTSNGDVYGRHIYNGSMGDPQPTLVGNFWGGGAVSIEKGTLGQLKARFRQGAK